MSVPEEQVDALTRALQSLEPESLQISVARSEPEPPASDARELRLEIIGSDRPGIVHDISQALADRGINVDELRTEIMSAPMSGELLFLANADLLIPADLDLDLLRNETSRRWRTSSWSTSISTSDPLSRTRRFRGKGSDPRMRLSRHWTLDPAGKTRLVRVSAQLYNTPRRLRGLREPRGGTLGPAVIALPLEQGG